MIVLHRRWMFTAYKAHLGQWIRRTSTNSIEPCSSKRRAPALAEWERTVSGEPPSGSKITLRRGFFAFGAPQKQLSPDIAETLVNCSAFAVEMAK